MSENRNNRNYNYQNNQRNRNGSGNQPRLVRPQSISANKNYQGRRKPTGNNNSSGNNYPVYQQPQSVGLSPNVKGIIAILITLLIVVIVIMLFAKSLFVKNDTEPKATGKITSTSYIPPQTTVSVKTEATQDNNAGNNDNTDDEDDFEEDTTSKSSDDDSKGTVSCISAVYLHPSPSANSANLATIPVGAECKFYKNENGWYYVEYNGQKGYAWNTFFNAPQT